MRKLTRRDLLATLIIAAVVVPFIGYSARESMPFVHDPRGMAGVGVAGGLLAFAVLGCTPFGTGSLEQTMGPSQCSPSDAASPRCSAKLLGAAGPDDGRDRDHVGAGPGTRRRIPHAKPRRQAHLNITLKARLPPPPGRPPARRVTAWQLSPSAMAAVAGP